MKLKADIIKCGFDELKKIAEIESKCIPDGWSLKAFEDWFEAVSYTHLTLPTILRV